MQTDIMQEVTKLIKSLTALSNLVMIYLTITWGYAGLEYLLRSFIN